MTTITFVRIPDDMSEPLEDISIDLPGQIMGDQIPKYLEETMKNQDRFTIQTSPLKRMAPFDAVAHNEDSESDLAGVYAYYCSSTTGSELDRLELKPNVRATCLSMACGLHSQRFYGDVFISRLGYFSNESGYHLINSSLESKEVQYACETPDLRIAVIQEVNPNAAIDRIFPPQWLTEAAKANYEDAAVLAVLASVMKRDKQGNESFGESGYESDNSSVSDSDESNHATKAVAAKDVPVAQSYVAKVPLCLQCRRPSRNLCPHCEGMQFCGSPRDCAQVGWSHQSICKTWAQYTQRREELASFPFDWHLPLINRENQISEEPYKNYLTNDLGVLQTAEPPNWWSTETSGWSGGQSSSAKVINFMNRLSYSQGFAIDGRLLPPERPVNEDDVSRAGVTHESQCNLLDLNSWEEYYKVRDIPLESPVALLLTFPLTIYYALLKYGAVPITVARMLSRPIRIHVVGIEKELNFLDMFKELAFLLPRDLPVELVFIVRQDMLPESCSTHLHGGKKCVKVELTHNLTIMLESGTYNETLDPNFDCGTGQPDMVIGLNAGLFAYESWRSVIEYLDAHSGVVGAFTDYNEHSGVNCASLGGGKARESLVMNPFRQPHAMPVYSMNLPQFSNGFMYVFNEQELDL